ncbi:cation:proton antiporter [bacterium]
MEHGLVISITLVLVLGVGAQWVAWRVKMPSILLLLLIGFAAGPVYALLTGGAPLIDPDYMLGDLLFPAVSVSVALILFEGGLSLKFSELKKAGGVVIALVTAGALVTWALGTGAAIYLLGMKPDIAMLLGAILVVTGPTVIGPLLQDVRPKGVTRSILKWEGIVIDPIGAILAVLVFEYIALGGGQEPTKILLEGAARVIGTGLACGAACAGLLYIILRKFWIPDFLQSPMALMLAVGSFAASNSLAEESGLVAVTAMGVIMANQKSADIAHITEFNENLRVILISSLFVLLAARVKLDLFQSLGPEIVLFLLALVFVVRPAAVGISTLFSRLSMKERIFLSWMAPRGIVAAAVSSIFALKMAGLGRTDAGQIVPITFTTIVATVALYGLTAGTLARKLGLKQENPQGLLIIGTDPFSRMLAEDMHLAGIKVLMVDNNKFSAGAAKLGGFPTFFGNILNRHTIHNLDLDGIGKLFALSANDEVNSLAATLFSEVFGRSEVYQVMPKERTDKRLRSSIPLHLHGRYLFSKEMTHSRLDECIEMEADIKTTHLTEKFTYNDFLERYAHDVVPLLIINEKNEITVCTADSTPAPKPGQRIVALVYPEKVATGETVEK